MKTITVSIQTLRHYQGLPLPTYATPGSAGMDLLAAIDTPILIQPMERRLIPTGIAIALPEHYEAQIRPRSGLAIKHGITLLNTPGTIDADYRGEIKVIVINLGQEAFCIERGMRIAQMVFAETTQGEWLPQISLTETERGSGGFGHSGLR